MSARIRPQALCRNSRSAFSTVSAARAGPQDLPWLLVTPFHQGLIQAFPRRAFLDSTLELWYIQVEIDALCEIPAASV